MHNRDDVQYAAPGMVTKRAMHKQYRDYMGNSYVWFLTFLVRFVGRMDYLGLTGVSVLTVATLLCIWYKSRRKKRAPGPWGVPLFGYLPFLGDHPARKYFELSKKYGPIISVQLGPQTFTVLNDYEVIQEVST